MAQFTPPRAAKAPPGLLLTAWPGAPRPAPGLALMDQARTRHRPGPRREHAAPPDLPMPPPPPTPAGGLLGVQTLTDSFLVFFLSLLAKKCPRIMKKSIYSSDIQSGAFWNELAMGEFLSVFFFFFLLFAKQQSRGGSELSAEPPGVPDVLEALSRTLPRRRGTPAGCWLREPGAFVTQSHWLTQRSQDARPGTAGFWSL